MHFQTFETHRLTLRKLTDETYEEILRSYSDEDILKFLGVPKEDLEKEKAKAVKGFSTFNRSLLIFQLLDKSTGEILGWCGYHTWSINHDRAEIGYQLFNDRFKNKGFMTEALTEVLRFGFEEMKLIRVEALIGLENNPSLKLLQRFGFKQEGVLRKHYLVNGIYEDSVLFSLVNDDYYSRPQN